jgi:hypothetical protein
MPESQALCASSSGFQCLAAFAPSSTFKNTSFHPDVSLNTSNMDIQDFQALSGSLMLTVENHLIEPVNNNAASIEGLKLQYLSSYYSTPVYGPGSSNIITTRSGRVVEVAVADFFHLRYSYPTADTENRIRVFRCRTFEHIINVCRPWSSQGPLAI